SLLAAGVVERLPEPDETGRTVALTMDLQRGFALNQPLSAFALAAIELLDPASPSYALDVVSVIESTLEDPRGVLGAQQWLARGQAVAEMKADGLDYDERMELLDDVSWPKPLEELLTAALELYRHTHPWISERDLSPKSVARDLHERAMTFGEFIAFYKLTRGEGMVLRYLSDAYKALRQTVPLSARTEELTDIVEWLGEVVRQTDSSLLEEWEQLTSGYDGQLTPGGLDPLATARAGAERPLSANERALRVMVRTAMWRKVSLFALRRWNDLAALDEAAVARGREALDLSPIDVAPWDASPLDALGWQEAVEGYFAEYADVGTGPDARGPGLTVIHPEPGRWRVEQIIDDPAGDRDWRIRAVVDLAATDAAGELILLTTGAGPVSVQSQD
ncbi:MAG TPA: DUF3516 domain-containing protein, partial [Candidatus Lustribacter sp.]|nr:DUF3516 domain-containing protein [Candidatus Lustribacter sp.]